MDVSNPKFNVLLMTPGRTGSHMISYFLQDIVKVVKSYRMADQNFGPMEPKMLQHSHDPKDINLINENTVVILNIRNIIEIVLSNKIARTTNKWVYLKSPNIEIRPFTFEITEFCQTYEMVTKYYKEVSEVLPCNTIIIDYKDYKNNIYNLFEIFQIPKRRLLNRQQKMLTPLQTPGSHESWILNYDEIIEFSELLEQDPLNIIRKGSKNSPFL